MTSPVTGLMASDRPSGAGRPRNPSPVTVTVARIPPVMAMAVMAMAVPAIAVMVAVMVVGVPAIAVVGAMVAAVVAVAIPGHRLDQRAAPNALIHSIGQAGRAGLGRGRQKGKRKGAKPCRKNRLHLHQASPLVLGCCSPLCTP